MTTFSLTITSSDQTLVTELTRITGLSKTMVKRAMSCGAVWHRRTGKSKRVRRQNLALLPKDLIEFHYDEEILNSQPLTPTLQYQEPDFSIWFKPSGMPMTGSRFGDHTCLIRNIERQANLGKVYLTHRIDRYTCGLVIVAHNRVTAAELSRQFRERLIKKEYSAICCGVINQACSIDDDIDDKPALSHIDPMCSQGDYSLVNVEIETGRKHQIRRHLASIGHPILGDRQYGVQTGPTNRSDNTFDLQLCAWRLTILHPSTRLNLCVELDSTLRIDWDAFTSRPQT